MVGEYNIELDEYDRILGGFLKTIGVPGILPGVYNSHSVTITMLVIRLQFLLCYNLSQKKIGKALCFVVWVGINISLLQ